MHHLRKRRVLRRKVRYTAIAVILLVIVALLILFKIAFTGYITRGNIELPFIDPLSSGIGGLDNEDSYELLTNALFLSGNITRSFDGKLVVPWYASSSSCSESDLQAGSNCNVGTINFSNYCMVSDEFSQVGLLLSMAQNQTRMNEFYTTLSYIESSYGNLPSWRVYIHDNTIEPCHSGVNSNCDTASDSDARIIIALFTASNNPDFQDANQKEAYRARAIDLAEDFVKYEVEHTCRPSTLGYGPICHWLASGSVSRNSGLNSGSFAYTGYYPDAIIAMLQTCTNTGNSTYCAIASNFTLNYLQASKYQGSSFTVPPGKSFRWANESGTPYALCSTDCNPDHWDSADAPRAFGMCEAQYYSLLINYSLPGLDTYCAQWSATHVSNPTSVVLQYYADGSPSASPQNGYFAQGLQTLFQLGTYDREAISDSLDSALSHFSTDTNTWDHASCFGIYHGAFAIRSLGNAIGRDIDSFPLLNITFESNDTMEQNDTEQNETEDDPIENVTEENQTSSGGGGGGGGVEGQNESNESLVEPEQEVIQTSPIVAPDPISCTPSWECTWDECVDGLEQAVSCIDSNACGTREGLPAERLCTATTLESTKSLTGNVVKSVEEIRVGRTVAIILAIGALILAILGVWYIHYLRATYSIDDLPPIEKPLEGLETK